MRAQRIAAGSTLIDVALVALKLSVGLSIGSLGLISDAVHSLTDAASGAMAWFALHTAHRPPDREHPFGHGRAENLAAYTQGILILGAAALITWEAITRLGHPPSIAANYLVIALLVALLLFECGRVGFLLYVAKIKRSPALSANATEKAADILGLAAVLLGLLSVRIGYAWADSAAALAVAALITIAGIRLLFHAGDTLIDRSPTKEADKVRTIIAGVEGVLAVGEIRLRQSGGETIGEVRVAGRRTLSVEAAEALKVKISQAVGEQMEGMGLTLIVDPHIDAARLVERIHAVAGKMEVFQDIHNVTVEDESDGSRHVSLHAKLPAAMKLVQAQAYTTTLKAMLSKEMDAARVDVHLEPQEPDLVAGENVTMQRDELVRAVKRLALTIPGVLGCSDLELSQRAGGTVAYVTIELDPELSLEQAHSIESEVEKTIVGALPELHGVVAEAAAALK